MTFRAVDVLKSAALVLCEDTRHSRPLLDHFGVETPVASYHEHNEASMTPKVLARLADGDDVALISDAGTPLLSDPGARLVRYAIEQGVAVVPIPGSSAALAAFVASGYAGGSFTFLGFLPRKGRERQATIGAVVTSPIVTILYEAPNRLATTLEDLAKAGAMEREAVVARELTKIYEEFRRGTVGSLAAYYSVNPVRGEVVIVVAGAVSTPVSEDALLVHAERLRAEGATPREIIERLMAEHGASRNVAYRLAHARLEDR